MGRNSHKRSRSHYEADNRIGVGQTLSHLKDSTTSTASPSPDANGTSPGQEDDAGEWQQVESNRAKKRKKLPSKEKGNYPSIKHSAQSRLQHYVKLGDLQNLALYLLADGPSPQWCSVSHHANVRKVVALMVPGLEAGMFNGSIPLLDPSVPEQSTANGLETSAADSSSLAKKEEEENSPSHPVDPPSTLVSPPRSISRASPDDYYPKKLTRDRLPIPLQPLSDIFEHIWPVRTPGDDKYAKMHSPLAAMLISPIVKSRDEKRGKGPQTPTSSKSWKNERTPVTEYVASTQELMQEGYVLHPAHYNGTILAAEETAKRELDKTSVADGWMDAPNVTMLTDEGVSDKDNESDPILAGQKVLTMDCEMCITSPLGTTPQEFSLTRISLIDWDGNVLLDELVKPDKPITDYLTPYSGITPASLQNVATTLSDIQNKLINDILAPNTILVGHSLDSDLKALKLTHPNIIDTALLFPHPRGPPLKSSLKWLAQKYLAREIQKGHGTTGHDSIEDAKACLDLVKQKCEKGKAWGTSEASGESIFKRLARATRPKRDKVNPVGDDEARTGAVVDWGEPTRGYGAQAKVAIGCESDEQVVAGVKRAIAGDDSADHSTNTDSAFTPIGGVDFIFARLRELEAHRGWWNRSKTLDNEELRNSTAATSAETSLSTIAAQTVAHVKEVWDALPPCTAFLLFSGSGDPRPLAEMQALQQKFKGESCLLLTFFHQCRADLLTVV